MVHVFYIFLAVIVAGVGFFSGYKYAEPDASLFTFIETFQSKDLTNPEVQEAPVARVVPESIPEAKLEDPIDTIDAPNTSVEALPSETSFAERATQNWITFTDIKGRQLVAQLISTQDNSLEIRRQADGQTFNLPINMLSKQDQAFAAYLQSQRPKPKAEPTQSDIDNIFDRLFGE